MEIPDAMKGSLFQKISIVLSARLNTQTYVLVQAFLLPLSE